VFGKEIFLTVRFTVQQYLTNHTPENFNRFKIRLSCGFHPAILGEPPHAVGWPDFLADIMIE